MQSDFQPADRYARQLLLPEVGAEGQRRLELATVAVVGVGGIGSPAALALAAAGVGRLVLVDDDVVSLSNLPRQTLYAEADLGLPKVEAAAARLRAVNSGLLCTTFRVRLTKRNACELLAGCDLVVDGTDSYAARYALDDAAAALGVPYVYGAVAGCEGQVAVFGSEPRRRRYRDLYPEPPQAHPSLAVVGMATAVVGAVEAHEAMKLICGYGQPLAGRLWTIDLRTMLTFVVDV